MRVWCPDGDRDLAKRGAFSRLSRRPDFGLKVRAEGLFPPGDLENKRPGANRGGGRGRAVPWLGRLGCCRCASPVLYRYVELVSSWTSMPVG